MEPAPPTTDPLEASDGGPSAAQPQRVHPVDQHDPTAVRRSIRLSRSVGGLAALVAAIVLVGWATDAEFLTRILQGTGVMKPWSAVCFLMSGVALLLCHATTPRWRSIGPWLGLGPLAVGSLTCVQYLTDTQFGFDDLLFPEAVAATNLSNPGRMTPAASIGFTGLGAAILALEWRWRRWSPSQLIAAVPGIAGLVGFLGYIYGSKSLLSVSAYSSMAIHTSILFLSLSIAVLFARPLIGFPAPIMSRFTGGLLARRILPLAIVLPFVFGWLRLWGERAGLYGTPFGLSIFASSNIAMFVALVWLAAGRLNRIDGARQLVSERLRSSEARSRALHEHAVDLILTLDAAGRIRFANPAAQQMLGMAGDPDGTVRATSSLEELVDERDRPGLASALAACAKRPTNDAVPILLRVPRALGEPRQIEGAARNLLETPEVRGILINGRDVTEQRRQDAERRALETRFLTQIRESQKMQALGTLAGGIAHDFNNILAAIGGNLQLAREDLDRDDPVQRNLAEITRAADRASDLVRRILAFARRQETVMRVVELRTIVAEAIELLRSTLPAAIEVVTRLDAPAPQVAVDPTQMHQVLMNLGTNAAHAIGSRGGTITISIEQTSIDAEFARTVSELREGVYARLSVRDDGCGIEPAVVQHIFEPFFTTKPVGQGTGLGLSVVDGIIRNHGGAISVYSEVGKGTVVHVYLPAATSAPASAAVAPMAPPRGESQRILFVDDEEALAWLAQRFLERLGYRVTAFTEPAKALQAFMADPEGFDAVVTDLSMPGMAGPELARRILALRPSLPVLMTSGYVTPEDVAVAKQLGVRDVLLKPNSMEELAVALHRALRSATVSDVDNSARAT